MKILLISATLFEIEATVNWLRGRAETEKGNVLQFGKVSVEVLFTGVGLTATAYTLGARFGNGWAQKTKRATTLAWEKLAFLPVFLSTKKKNWKPLRGLPRCLLLMWPLFPSTEPMAQRKASPA